MENIALRVNIEGKEEKVATDWDAICSGQVKLATVLESFQYKRSDSFGVNPPLY
ncbi:hypothetical protein ACRN9N_21125 [Shewanella baltica]|uniref:hypothetical protein n=1 Tax=Shewanella baltica TaxID=62322 RepID=UPI003D7B766D